MFGIPASLSYITLVIVVKGEGPRVHCMKFHSSSVNLGTLYKPWYLFSHLHMSETTHRVDPRMKTDRLHKGLSAA